MTMNFLITMKDDEHHGDLSGSVKVDFGLSDMSFDLAILAAFIEDEFLNIKLGSLLEADVDPNDPLNGFTDGT